MVDRTLSHYRIVDRLGAGAMGEVYLAEDIRLGRKVALKLLPPHLTRDEAAKTRLIHEARAASLLDHPEGTVLLRAAVSRRAGTRDGLLRAGRRSGPRPGAGARGPGGWLQRGGLLGSEPAARAAAEGAGGRRARRGTGRCARRSASRQG